MRHTSTPNNYYGSSAPILQPAAPDYRKLFLHNLDFKLNQEDLCRIFGVFGRVTGVQLPKDKEGRTRGLGFIEFETHESARKAL